jgi:hypothetical protein
LTCLLRPYRDRCVGRRDGINGSCAARYEREDRGEEEEEKKFGEGAAAAIPARAPRRLAHLASPPSFTHERPPPGLSFVGGGTIGTAAAAAPVSVPARSHIRCHSAKTDARPARGRLAHFSQKKNPWDGYLALSLSNHCAQSHAGWGLGRARPVDGRTSYRGVAASRERAAPAAAEKACRRETASDGEQEQKRTKTSAPPLRRPPTRDRLGNGHTHIHPPAIPSPSFEGDTHIKRGTSYFSQPPPWGATPHPPSPSLPPESP